MDEGANSFALGASFFLVAFLAALFSARFFARSSLNFVFLISKKSSDSDSDPEALLCSIGLAGDMKSPGELRREAPDAGLADLCFKRLAGFDVGMESESNKGDGDKTATARSV